MTDLPPMDEGRREIVRALAREGHLVSEMPLTNEEKARLLLDAVTAQMREQVEEDKMKESSGEKEESPETGRIPCSGCGERHGGPCLPR